MKDLREDETLSHTYEQLHINGKVVDPTHIVQYLHFELQEEQIHQLEKGHQTGEIRSQLLFLCCIDEKSYDWPMPSPQ